METMLYYNKEKRLLIVTDKNAKPVAGFSGNITERKYNEYRKDTLQRNTLTRKDLENELELCKSVLLNNGDNLPPDIRVDYQNRYRKAKQQLEILTNKMLQK